MEGKRLGGPWYDKDGNYHSNTQVFPKSNIFENAYFGKPYKTRDDRNAIFIKCATERNDVDFKYYCAIEDLDGIYEVFDSQGRCYRDSVCPIDIVSEADSISH